MRQLLLGLFVSAALTAPFCPTLAFAATTVIEPEQPKPSSPNGGITGIDAMTSSVYQQGQSSFSGLGARLRMRSERFVRNVEILPGIEYWQNSSKVSTPPLKTVRRDATMAVDIRWVFSHAHWQPYGGGGLALHFLNEQVKAPTLGIDDDHSTVRGAFALLGGVQFGVAEKLGSFVEIKFHDVSGYRQFKFSTGLSWNY